jgi:hypothetical protein
MAGAAAGDDADLWAGGGGVDYLVFDIATDGGVGVRDALQRGSDEVGGVVDEVFCWVMLSVGGPIDLMVL